ncbi:MAG TPA: DedA family protein [Gemmatimonadota bacterium]|nr:DedA family protein [Gemmatimonadota bacterium]
MELLTQLLDMFLHLDAHLREILERYGTWTYLILFLIVFCETGLVITPFLPGDSLLFAAGAFAAVGALDLGLTILLLIAAAILGDTVNYWIGYGLRQRLSAGWEIPFVKQRHLDRTHDFYEKYGAKTIILARFVPIVRTLAPFVAGVGEMTYARFMSYNVVGGVLWVVICTLAGFFFGNLPGIRDHFSLLILGVIVISLLPGMWELWRARRASPAQDPHASEMHSSK